MPTSELRKFEILLVEDNPADARLVSLALKGFEVEHYLRTVTDGQLALDFLQKRNSYTDAPRPDIILLDWKLPSCDGSDLLRVIRQDPTLQGVPVIVVSGVDMGELKRNLDGAGADLYVEKPITLDRFSHVLQYLLETSEKKKELPPGGLNDN